jgi:hypothetical protein
MTKDPHPSSADHDRPIAAMTWHRRRIRRARHHRESAPQPVTRAAQASDGRSPVIRRLVVFVPRAKRVQRAVVDVVAAAAPAVVPEPA